MAIPAQAPPQHNLGRGQPILPHLLLDHRHGTNAISAFCSMTVPEDVGRHLPHGELLPGLQAFLDDLQVLPEPES